ncbi:uncharacterized protein ACWYII_010642 [Salvelinus alpinus]
MKMVLKHSIPVIVVQSHCSCVAGSGLCMQTMEMKRGLAMEPVAVQEYCTLKNVNFFPCGFVVHPDAPWLGSSPDGIIFDPSIILSTCTLSLAMDWVSLTSCAGICVRLDRKAGR